jgi:hypothetical protein
VDSCPRITLAPLARRQTGNPQQNGGGLNVTTANRNVRQGGEEFERGDHAYAQQVFGGIVRDKFGIQPYKLYACVKRPLSPKIIQFIQRQLHKYKCFDFM